MNALVLDLVIAASLGPAYAVGLITGRRAERDQRNARDKAYIDTLRGQLGADTNH